MASDPGPDRAGRSDTGLTASTKVNVLVATFSHDPVEHANPRVCEQPCESPRGAQCLGCPSNYAAVGIVVLLFTNAMFGKHERSEKWDDFLHQPPRPRDR